VKGDARPILKITILLKIVDTFLFNHGDVKTYLAQYIPASQLAQLPGGCDLLSLSLSTVINHLGTECFVVGQDIQNAFNTLSWEAITELCDRHPLLSAYARLLFGTGPQQVSYVCHLTHDIFEVSNVTGGAQGLPSTSLLCAALLGPVQMLVADLFDCSFDDAGKAARENRTTLQGHSAAQLGYADDGYSIATDLSSSLRMTLFMADNDPLFLTPDQRLRLPGARQKIFDKLKTWRTSLSSIGCKFNTTKLFAYCARELTDMEALSLQNIRHAHTYWPRKQT
jgi:hypothetical protein